MPITQLSVRKELPEEYLCCHSFGVNLLTLHLSWVWISVHPKAWPREQYLFPHRIKNRTFCFPCSRNCPNPGDLRYFPFLPSLWQTTWGLPWFFQADSPVDSVQVPWINAFLHLVLLWEGWRSLTVTCLPWSLMEAFRKCRLGYCVSPAFPYFS